MVNTACGAVIDVNALVRALEQHKLAAVGLDVLPIEPIDAASPLLKDPRVILSPHAAFYSIEAEIELRRKAAMEHRQMDENRAARLSGGAGHP
jgi:D-3-phosphoglycerate dehydrogenase